MYIFFFQKIVLENEMIFLDYAFCKNSRLCKGKITLRFFTKLFYNYVILLFWSNWYQMKSKSKSLFLRTKKLNQLCSFKCILKYIPSKNSSHYILYFRLYKKTVKKYRKHSVADLERVTWLSIEVWRLLYNIWHRRL